MPKMLMYAIKDVKVGVFNTPFTATHKAVAERMFCTAVNDENSYINQYPEDYELYQVGEFDKETGVLEGTLEYVGCGTSYVIESR